MKGFLADAAQPQHNSKHHDVWEGDNRKGYTRDPDIHGRFESPFVDLVKISEGDLLPLIGEPRYLSDPWSAILDHMIEARGFAEEVHRLDPENPRYNPATGSAPGSR